MPMNCHKLLMEGTEALKLPLSFKGQPFASALPSCDDETRRCFAARRRRERAGTSRRVHDHRRRPRQRPGRRRRRVFGHPLRRRAALRARRRAHGAARGHARRLLLRAGLSAGADERHDLRRRARLPRAQRLAPRGRGRRRGAARDHVRARRQQRLRRGRALQREHARERAARRRRVHQLPRGALWVLGLRGGRRRARDGQLGADGHPGRARLPPARGRRLRRRSDAPHDLRPELRRELVQLARRAPVVRGPPRGHRLRVRRPRRGRRAVRAQERARRRRLPRVRQRDAQGLRRERVGRRPRLLAGRPLLHAQRLLRGDVLGPRRRRLPPPRRARAAPGQVRGQRRGAGPRREHERLVSLHHEQGAREGARLRRVAPRGRARRREGVPRARAALPGDGGPAGELAPHGLEGERLHALRRVAASPCVLRA